MIPYPHPDSAACHLWRAVLEMAFHDLTSPSKTIRRSALNWFLSPSREPNEPGSFPWICDQLHLSPSSILAATLKRYHQKETYDG